MEWTQLILFVRSMRISEPNWIIAALIGGAVGWLLPYAIRLVWYIIRRSKKDNLEGIWYGYHWSYIEGQPKLYKSTWIIHKAVFHWLSVRQKLEDGMTYKGYVMEERGQLVVKTHRPENKETAMYRFTWPIASKNSRLMHGTWLSFDHDIKIASGGHILSRNHLEDEEAIAKLNDSIKWEQTIPLMHVRV